MGKQIYIGADHAGFKLKSKITRWLKKKEIHFEDLGNLIHDPQDDYPDFAFKVARMAVKEKTFGILLCGSAHGMCIAANKIKGARAIVAYSVGGAKKAREHNDANIICLSGWHSHFFRAKRVLKAFLTTSFSKEARHIRRLDKIKKIEEE